jgi:hypothetical protein
MMDELILWSCVVGGTPLALAFLGRAAGWTREAMRTRVTAREVADERRSMSDRSLHWTHA